MNNIERRTATPTDLCARAPFSNYKAIPGPVSASEAISAVDGYHVLLECLADAMSEPTVIVDSDGAHRFSRLFRVFRQTSWVPVTPGSADAGLVLLREAARMQTSYSGNLPTSNGAIPARCVPVLGPSGAVHALRMNIGAAGSGDIPVIPLEFDSNYIARFGSPHGRMPAAFRTDTTWTLPALLEHVVWLNRLELISMFDPVEPPPRWCGSLIFNDPATTTRRHLWMAARSVTDHFGLRIVRAVIADITDTIQAPSWDPMTEHLSTRALRGHGSALMDLRTTLMHSFRCDDNPRLPPGGTAIRSYIRPICRRSRPRSTTSFTTDRLASPCGYVSPTMPHGPRCERNALHLPITLAPKRISTSGSLNQIPQAGHRPDSVNKSLLQQNIPAIRGHPAPSARPGWSSSRVIVPATGNGIHRPRTVSPPSRSGRRIPSPDSRGSAMKPLPYQASTHEKQFAMAILAHATRHDNYALAMSLKLLAESPDELHPLCVIAALVSAFQRGLDTDNSEVVAQRFSDLALSLAAADAAK